MSEEKNKENGLHPEKAIKDSKEVHWKEKLKVNNFSNSVIVASLTTVAIAALVLRSANNPVGYIRSIFRNRPTVWRDADKAVMDRFGTDVCNVERLSVNDLSSEMFENEYRYKKPVIVTFPNGASDWTKPEKWSLQSLLEEYGNWAVLSGNAREIVRQGGSGEVRTSFTDYIDRLMDEPDQGEPL